MVLTVDSVKQINGDGIIQNKVNANKIGKNTEKQNGNKFVL